MQIMGHLPQNAADTFNIYLTTNTSGISETLSRFDYHMSLCITLSVRCHPATFNLKLSPLCHNYLSHASLPHLSHLVEKN